MPASVTDKDKGYAALFKRLKDGKALELTVGVHGPEGSTDAGQGVTVLDIATIHEYGLGDCPERSWLRAWADQFKPDHEAALRKIGQAVYKGSFTAEIGLERAGNLFVGQIQERIANNIPPPLAPATIARKGSDVALINTGHFRSSITYRVTVKQ